MHLVANSEPKIHSTDGNRRNLLSLSLSSPRIILINFSELTNDNYTTHNPLLQKQVITILVSCLLQLTLSYFVKSFNFLYYIIDRRCK